MVTPRTTGLPGPSPPTPSKPMAVVGAVTLTSSISPSMQAAWPSLWGEMQTRTPQSLPDLPGYEILGEIGRGGMGAVYRAFHQTLKRQVAIKVMLAGAYATSEDWARFRKEAETLARLQHPHIVQIYEVGESQGRPYLALEFVEGLTLDRYAGGKPLPPRQTAEIIRALAEAVSYAHGQGVIHRDLKPGNVMMTRALADQPKYPTNSSGRNAAPATQRVEPGSPSRWADHAQELAAQVCGGTDEANGEKAEAPLIPKLMDFGLAKQLDDAGHLTTSGVVVGTPQFMAPEQAEGHVSTIGPSADIYALGTIMYDLLTGRPPFQAATLVETLRLVATVEPIPPTRFHPGLPPDLETICLKCLQKEPIRRYATAEALAEDLRRFLTDEPILARPISTWERCRRWGRRHPGIAVLITAVTLLLLLSTLGALLSAVWIDQARRRADENAAAEQHARIAAQQSAAESRQRLVRLDIATGNNYAHAGDEEAALLWYAQAWLDDAELSRGEESHRQRVAAVLDRGPKLVGLCIEEEEICDAHWAPDGRRLLVRTPRQVSMWDPFQGRKLFALAQEGPLTFATWSPDGKSLATCGTDKTVRLWDSVTGAARTPPLVHPAAVHACVFRLDGAALATACADGKVRFWTTSDGRPQGPEIACAAVPLHVLYRPDGQAMLVVDDRQQARFYRCDNGLSLGAPLPHQYRTPNYETVLPQFLDGGRLLLTVEPPALKLWEVDSGRLVDVLPAPAPVVTGVGIDAAGKRAVVAARGIHGYLVSRGAKQPAAQLQHPRMVWHAALTRNGALAATACSGGMMHLWDGRTGQSILRPFRHLSDLRRLAFSPDDRFLLSASMDGTVRVWDCNRPRSTAERYDFTCGQAHRFGLFERDGAMACLSPDGQAELLLTGESARGVLRATGQPLFPPVALGAPIDRAGYCGNGRSFWLLGGTRLRLYDAGTGEPLAEPLSLPFPARQVQVDDEGERGVLLHEDGRARVWNLRTGELLLGPLGQYNPGPAPTPRNPPATATPAPPAETPRPAGIEALAERVVTHVALSPDGQWVAVVHAHEPDYTQVYELATGRSFRTDALPGVAVQPVFSADSRRVIVGGSDTLARVWDVTTGSPLGPALRHAIFVRRMTLSHDGSRAVTFTADSRLHVWDSRSGDVLYPGLQLPLVERAQSLWFSADDRRVIVRNMRQRAVQVSLLHFAGARQDLPAFIGLMTGREVDPAGGYSVPLNPLTFRRDPERFLHAWRTAGLSKQHP